ncbi:uncharacterized protein LOC129944854 [Eupeodes corollae]|uniref:uncharacterized protein LOC129944854 n=1 Tax=Eupeodes corollae TaxID=290404 RepID=UPI002491333A|nr:uncharacterized protein LOC129944854 [Eupeodes corollae]
MSIENPLPDSLKNLNGFALRTTVQTDTPRVFWYTDRNCRRHIGGSSGQLFVQFLKRHNATFIEADIKNLDSEHVFKALNGTFKQQVDISMNTFEFIEGLDQSYPIALLSWAIMVPVNVYVDSSQYFVRPFQPMVWLCFGITLGYLIATDMLKDWLVKVPVDFWNSFSRIFKTFLNTPLQKPTTYAYWFNLQVRVLAFICVNLYLIYMTSFLTVYIKVNQYESMQDLIENNFPVAMLDYDWKFYSKFAVYPASFKDILVLLNREVFLRELEPMRNTSFAYAEGSDKLNFLIKSQIKPKFRIIRDNLMEYYLGFILSPNSPFKEILNDFIFDVLSTGLMDKWTQNSYVQAVHEGLIQSDLENALAEGTIRPFTLYHFKFVWVCFGFGNVIAIGVFVGEILFAVFSRRMCRFC